LEVDILEFTHFDDAGRPKMVNVGDKNITIRTAVAVGSISMASDTFDMIVRGKMKKGDVLSTAQIAGIMGAKQTPYIIPMCHNIILDGIDINFDLDKENSRIKIEAKVKCSGKTGVEMEALTAVSICALTIYDMCKAVDKKMVISDITLLKKTGGKSDINNMEAE
jgi:cyclic pyranopterin phosphate synthase